jgi:hypothetical protein
MTEFWRGFFWIRPVHYHKAFHQWIRGQATSCNLILLCIPIIIFAAGFFVGQRF